MRGTRTGAQLVVATLKASGVRRVYGLPGDSLNGLTDALRAEPALTWQHVRHEEAAALAAAAEATLTGGLSVCAASCGPGNLHLVNGLFDAQRSRVPVLAIAGHIPQAEIGTGYFQETHPQELFRECSVYVELVSVPEQLPRLLQIAMRTALQRRGVAVLVIPPEIFTHHAPSRPVVGVHTTSSLVRPDDAGLAAAASLLNRARAVTILAGAGCEGAHDEVVSIADRLKAPVVHAMRGKEFVEYDNPFDVGMTGLLGYVSGYRAMEHCDALLVLGSDFPYGPFYPDDAKVVQVDVRGEQIGRRVPVDVPLVGTVKDTVAALLPLLEEGRDVGHVERMTAHYRRARRSLRQAGGPGARRRAAASSERRRGDRPAGDAGRRGRSGRRHAHPVGGALPAHERQPAADRVLHPRDDGQRPPPGDRRPGGVPGTAGGRLLRRRRAGHAPRRAVDVAAAGSTGEGRRPQQRLARLRRAGDEG